MRLRLVVPEEVDDPARPSGGNVYDLRLVAGLRARGHDVREVRTAPWGLEAALAAAPDGDTVVVDGLVACFAPRAVERHGGRLHVVVLAHMCFAEVAPDAAGDEGRALTAAGAVVTVSAWARDRLLARYPLDPARVTIAEPGADPAPLHRGSPRGTRLLCVGAVSRAKGLDVLADALGRVADLDWSCRVVGPLDREPELVSRLRATLAPRVQVVGPRGREALSRAYAAADLVVVPTLTESFGIVVVEALAHGVPVVASDVGGVPEAVGRAADGRLPGALVPAGDAGALADALRTWWTRTDLRSAWRAAAESRRGAVAGWDATAARVEKALAGRSVEVVS